MFMYAVGFCIIYTRDEVMFVLLRIQKESIFAVDGLSIFPIFLIDSFFSRKHS